MVRVKLVHGRDVAAGYGRVWLPYAYAAKWPEANRKLGWQYLFPSSKLILDPSFSAAPSACKVRLIGFNSRPTGELRLAQATAVCL